MKVRENLIKVGAAAALLVISASAFAGNVWNNYHWGTTVLPIPLQVVDSVTQDWQFELETSISEWNGLGNEFAMSISSPNDSKKTRKQCKMSSGKIRVCNASYGFNGWLGLASINVSGDHITQGTAKVNDSYSSYWADPNQKRHVMCQEIGHLFGLNHTSTDRSSQKTCMDYSDDPASISPNAHDYETLATIYDGHLGDVNTWDDGSDGGDEKPCKGKKCRSGSGSDVPFGLLVASSKNHEIWVASDGRGGYWVTHIRLVPAEWRDPSLHR